MAAIYQWFPLTEISFTTTLYPLEAIDGMNFTFDIDVGSLTEVTGDDSEYNPLFMGGGKVEVLINTSVEDDSKYSPTIEDIYKVRVLYDITVEDLSDYSPTFVDAAKLHVLIRGWMPDEGMDFAFDLDTANCSMTTV